MESSGVTSAELVLASGTLALVARLLRLSRVEDTVWRASAALAFFLLQLMVTVKQSKVLN